jgi:large repetitive protein
MRLRSLAFAFVPFLFAACGGASSTPTAPTVNCAVSVPQTSISITAAGGSSAIPVTATAGCAWTVTSSQSWLTITSGAGATGNATVTVSAAENTGTERTAIVTIGGVQVTVTQAAAPPPIVFNPVPPNPVVGVAYAYQFTAIGGTGSFTYSLEAGAGVPPIGIVLSANGAMAGTTTSTAAATFGVCATDTAARSVCRRVTLAPTAATTALAVLGNWGGNIILNTGCTAPLPQVFPWTGTIRTATGGGIEIVVSVPRLSVANETHAVTITGQRMTFTVDINGPYTFVADFSADFRSLSGSFIGSNCTVQSTVVTPAGTWTGTRQ